MSTLLILDGNAVIHRAFHSVPLMTNGGQQVNALYGFYSTLISAIDKIKPKYLAICMDPPGPVFRNTEFMGYRMQRKSAPPELKSQFPLVRQSVLDSGLEVFSVGGYEADDAIATIVKKSLKKINKKTKLKLVKKIFVLTGDRDLMQLISPQVNLLMPLRGLSDLLISGSDQSVERLGVTPDKVVDLKAITGDTSDNYPGVPGVGPVGAIKLLEEFKTLDNIYANLDKIPEKLRQKLIENKDNAYLSQRLAQLVYDVPLDFKLSSLLYSKKTKVKIKKMLSSYNFRSLVSRISGNQAQTLYSKKYKPDESNPNQQSLF